MRRVVLGGMLVAVVAGCAAHSGAGDSASAAAPAATATTGRFALSLTLSQLAYRSDEVIVGRAVLAVSGEDDVRISSTGASPIAFSFAEVGGTRRMDAGWRGPCRSLVIGPGVSVAADIRKSGGWTAEDPNASFYESFFADPAVRLPPGTWDISAVAEFAEGDCDGAWHQVTAVIRVTVGQ